MTPAKLNMRAWLTVVGIALTFIILVGVALADEGPKWGYSGAEGPANWGALDPQYSLCSTGKEQSPVDIPANAAVNPADITFKYAPSGLTVLNNGHTIQANYDPGSAIIVGGKTYNLLQFHFHAKSEHTLNGQPTDMEIHFVHQAADKQLAVVGVMLKRGAENRAYAPVMVSIPTQPGDPKPVAGVTVNAADMLPPDHAYYRYNGSLTTPPCSEGMQWLVMTTPVQLSDAQMAAYEKVFPNTARPVQALLGRVFLLTSARATLPSTGADTFSQVAVLLIIGLLTLTVGASLRHR